MIFELPSDWKWVSFKDLLSEPLRNGIYKKKEFHGRGSKIVNMGELFAHSRLKSGVKMKRVELNKNEQKKALLQAGDLIFARRSLTAEGAGKCSVILSLDEPTTFESSIIRARLNPTIANSEFYYYLFNSPFGRWLLGTILRQVAVAGITGSDLANLEVPQPPKTIQDQLVCIARSIDEKIELNRQTNQTLEQITKALFKSWFVDFEPTRAKIVAKQAGLDPERAAMAAVSGKTVAELDQLDAAQLAQLKMTASLFSDGLVESELGEVPEGWGVVRFNQIVEKYIDNRGKTPPTIDEGIPLLEVKHLPDNSIKPNLNTAKYVDEATYNSWFRAHLESEDLIISTVGTIGRICMTLGNEKVAIAQNLLGMRFDRSKSSPYFMYYQMGGYRFRHDVDARLVVTVQASIKRKDLETIDLLAPPIELQNQFENLVRPFIEAQQSNQEVRLTELRDTLLPKLLSGELSTIQTEAV